MKSMNVFYRYEPTFARHLDKLLRTITDVGGILTMILQILWCADFSRSGRPGDRHPRGVAPRVRARSRRAAVRDRVERFDRRGTEPFEPFEPFEFF